MSIATQKATIHTNRGDIVIELYGNHAPETVSNFVGLADGSKDYSQANAKGEKSGPFYDGSIFHRVISGFMIQGGDPTGTGTGGPGYQFDDELDAARSRGYRTGTLAMANAGPNTNGSQFFITHVDAGLPPNYSVFGKVLDGQEVVNAIATTSTDGRDKPREDITIRTVDVHEDA